MHASAQYTLHVTFVYGSIKYLCTRRALFSLFPFHSLALFLAHSIDAHRIFFSLSFSSNKQHCHVNVYKCPHTNVGPCWCMSAMCTSSDERICMIVFDFIFMSYHLAFSSTPFVVCVLWYVRDRARTHARCMCFSNL